IDVVKTPEFCLRFTVRVSSRISANASIVSFSPRGEGGRRQFCSARFLRHGGRVVFLRIFTGGFAMAAKDGLIDARKLQGFKYFELLDGLLERLRPVATQRDRAGNREFFFDHYAVLMILYYF